MQLIKSFVLVAVLAVCLVQATILSESVSLLEAHVKDADTLASKKAEFVRMVERYYRPSAKAFWTQHAVPRAAAGLETTGRHWNEYIRQPRF